MKRLWRPCCLLLLLSIGSVLSGPLWAQSEATTGVIEGIVSDPQGAVIPGATLTITNVTTAQARRLTTDANGFFRSPLLPLGTYRVSVEHPGFATLILEGVEVTLGKTVRVDAGLQVGGLGERVLVAAEESLVGLAQTETSAGLGEGALRELPTGSRDYLDHLFLTPNVHTSMGVDGPQINVNGQKNVQTGFIVDGAHANNSFFGEQRGGQRPVANVILEAVQEFQVVSEGAPAEFGGYSGAFVNVVTKSGSNRTSGSVFEFYRDKSLNATDAINELNNRPKSPYHYNQFGGTLGGPIRRDRDFFFINYDGQRNKQPNDVFLNLPANTPSDPATLAAIAQLRPLAESWIRTQDQDVFLVKTDHQLTPAHRLTLRYNHQSFTGEGFESGGPQNSLEHTGASKVSTDAFNVAIASVLGSSLFNEVRAQYARDKEPGFANSDKPEATIRQSGSTVLVIGRNFFSPRETTITRWQFADTVTWARGDHKVKAGLDFQFDDILNFFPGNFSGSYTFNSLAGYQSRRPTASGERYVQAFPGDGTTGPTTRPDIQEYSFFAQDEWRLTADVTLNAGLRYDLQKFAKPQVRNPDAQLAAAGIDTSVLNTDTNNWGPRIGVAWSPAGKRYVARAGYGIFYGRTPSIMVGTAHSNNGINVQTITFTGSQVPTYPGILPGIPAGVALPRPTIFVFDGAYENARVHQASVGFDMEIAPYTSVGVNYLFVKGTDLPRSTDINIGASSPVTFTVTGTGEQLAHYQFAAGPFQNFARIIAFQSSADSIYNGVTLEINRRFAGHLQARAAYTIGGVEDNVPDATAVVPASGDDAKFASNPANFDTDRTDGNNDQRHRFVASAIYTTDRYGRNGIAGTLLDNWTFSVIFTAQSGQPYSAYVSADINRDGNNRNDIAPGTGRNEFRLPAQVSLDPRIARDIPIRQARLQLIFEAFNLLNRDNISSVRTGLYSSTGTTLTRTTNFQEPLTTSGPRIIQLAAKVLF